MENLPNEFIVDFENNRSIIGLETLGHPYNPAGLDQMWRYVLFPFKTNGMWKWYEEKPKFIPIISYNDYVKLKNKNISIIYYLKDQQYLPALKTIKDNYDGGPFEKGSGFYKIFNDACIIDVWFTTEKPIKPGDKFIVLDHGSQYTSHFEAEIKYGSRYVKNINVDPNTILEFVEFTSFKNCEKVIVLKEKDKDIYYIFGYTTKENKKNIRLATQEEIDNNYEIEIEGYTAKKTNDKTISFGCQEFEMDEIKAIRRFLGRNIKIELKVGETKITPSLLDKIINKFK